MNVFEKKYTIIMIFTVAAVFLMSPLIFRTEPTIAGDAPYYHARLAVAVKNNPDLTEDQLSYNGRPYIFNPYHYILAAAITFTSIETASKSLPLIIGILSLFFFYLVVNQHTKKTTTAYTLLTLGVSPAFLYVFSTSNSYGFAVLLSLASIYLFQKNRLYIISFAFLAITSLFDIVASLLTLTILFTLAIKNRKYMIRLYGAVVSLAIVYIPFIIPTYLSIGLPYSPILPSNYLQSIISDLGALIGIAPFLIILALIGFALTWRRKRKLYPIYLAISGLLILSYYASYVNIYLTFILAAFAGVALDRLTRMRYQIKLIKRLTIVLVLCGLIFSSISYLNRAINLPPDAKTMEALTVLSNEQPGLVLSDYTRGHFITYSTGFPVYTDSNLLYAPDVDRRLQATQIMFNSSTLAETTQILSREGISYIVIDRALQTDLFKDRTGFLYLTRNNETFKSVFSSSSIEIWEFLGE